MTPGPHAAITTNEVPVSPDAVWELLADGRRYADWVVGASHVREVEPDWPAVGSKFHHTVGIWPLHLRDTTAVEECEVGRRLVLEARARPFGRARVEITLEEISDGTRVTMSEEASSPLWARWSNLLLAPVLHVRNIEALRRFAVLLDVADVPDAEPSEGGPPPDGGEEPDPLEAALDREIAERSPSSRGGTT